MILHHLNCISLQSPLNTQLPHVTNPTKKGNKLNSHSISHWNSHSQSPNRRDRETRSRSTPFSSGLRERRKGDKIEDIAFPSIPPLTNLWNLKTKMSRIFEYFVVCGIGPEIRTIDGNKGFHGTGCFYLPSLLDQYPPLDHTLYPPPPPQLPTVSSN